MTVATAAPTAVAPASEAVAMVAGTAVGRGTGTRHGKRKMIE